MTTYSPAAAVRHTYPIKVRKPVLLFQLSVIFILKETLKLFNEDTKVIPLSTILMLILGEKIIHV